MQQTNTIHNIHTIHTIVGLFLLSKFIPIKVRWWRPMLDATYRNGFQP